MNPMPSLEPGLPVSIAATLATLAAIYLCGRLLLPAWAVHGSKLLRLALTLTSGLLFVSCASAVVALQRLNYLSVIPVLQIVFAAHLYWQRRKGASAANEDRLEAWTWRELAALAGVCVAAVVLFHLPYQRSFADGSLREVHDDLGYFAQMVIAIPEAKMANLWVPTLGEQAVGVTGGRDMWYHWGAIFLAIGIKKTFGLPAMCALLDVACAVINIILVVVAAAVAGALARWSTAWLLVVGAVSVTATQMMKIPDLLVWMSTHLPYGQFQHSKVPLALFFAYKFEAIVVLSALAAWLTRCNKAAVLLLFCAAVSAPHTVAACGVTGAALAAAGVGIRKAALWRTGLMMTGIAALAWAVTVLVFRADMAGAGGSVLAGLSVASLAKAVSRGVVDAGVSLVLSIISLPGILHLIRTPSSVENAERTQAVGWMALGGIAGSCGAFHLLHHMTDIFHVMLFVQSVLVMPAGIWGLARMMHAHPGFWHRFALALVSAAFLMGVHDLVVPRYSRIKTVWRTGDLLELKNILRGQTVGYFAREDRGWWIPKHAVLASMMESRCVRLNFLQDEQGRSTSRFYGFTKPFELLPPDKNENAHAWSVRFAHKLGSDYLLETWQDRLPRSIQARVKMVASVAGIRLYKWKVEGTAMEKDTTVTEGESTVRIAGDVK